MGIKLWAQLGEFIRPHGVYNRYASHYNINIDGEYMWHKGLNQANVTVPDRDAEIAKTACVYLARLVGSIKHYLPGVCTEVRVYMDGSRQPNKAIRDTSSFAIGDNLRLRVRDIFLTHLQELGATYRAIMLEPGGEAELQMYLRRDRAMGLNVFLTNDSDMMAICYGHRCQLPGANDLQATLGLEQVTLGEGVIPTMDSNYHYHVQDARQVVDSCVWFNSRTDSLDVFGFDNLADRVGLTVSVFRMMCYLSGTDYSNHLLTKTMLSAILCTLRSKPIGDRVADQLNALTQASDRAVALFFLGLAGTVRRGKLTEADRVVNVSEWDVAFAIYDHYLSTGVMRADVPYKAPSGVLWTGEFMFALAERASPPPKKDLLLKALTTVPQAVMRFRTNHYAPHWVSGQSIPAADPKPFRHQTITIVPTGAERFARAFDVPAVATANGDDHDGGRLAKETPIGAIATGYDITGNLLPEESVFRECSSFYDDVYK